MFYVGLSPVLNPLLEVNSGDIVFLLLLRSTPALTDVQQLNLKLKKTRDAKASKPWLWSFHPEALRMRCICMNTFRLLSEFIRIVLTPKALIWSWSHLHLLERKLYQQAMWRWEEGMDCSWRRDQAMCLHHPPTDAIYPELWKQRDKRKKSLKTRKQQVKKACNSAKRKAGDRIQASQFSEQDCDAESPLLTVKSTADMDGSPMPFEFSGPWENVSEGTKAVTSKMISWYKRKKFTVTVYIGHSKHTSTVVPKLLWRYTYIFSLWRDLRTMTLGKGQALPESRSLSLSLSMLDMKAK